MNKKSNKKLMAGLIVLITLIIIGITCSGFLDNFKEGIKFLGISFGISAGLVLLLFIMKYIIKGADKLLGEGRTFNDRAIVLFSILILVSLTCRGFLKNFTLGIVFLIVSIAFVAITFLIMYGINSKKGAIKKAILAEKTSGEKMFILLTVLILVSLTCGGFIQNLKAGILFLIISIISSLALYLTVTEVKNENSIIGKIIRIETTFNQKMMILLSTIIMVSLTCGGFLRNLKAGIVFLMISIVFTTSMLMLVLGIKSKHKIYDKIAGFETTFNEKMIILLTTMAMVSITSGGFLYNFKLGMLFLTISLIFSGLVLAGVISVRPRVNIFKMRARIQNLGKKEAIRAFGMIFACVFITYTLSGTWAYFTNTDSAGNEVEAKITLPQLTVNYEGNSSSEDSGGTNVNVENVEYDGVTIYFENANNNYDGNLWEIPCVHYYTSNTNATTWPGRRMKHVNVPAGALVNSKDVEASKDYWVKYKIPKDDTIVTTFNGNAKFILNNNGDAQKNPINIPKYVKEIYVYKDGKVNSINYSQEEINKIESNIKKQYINIYYKNTTSDWSNFYLYTYTDDGVKPNGNRGDTNVTNVYIDADRNRWLNGTVERGKLSDKESFHVICYKYDSGTDSNVGDGAYTITINLKNNDKILSDVYITSIGNAWEASSVKAIYEDGTEIKIK